MKVMTVIGTRPETIRLSRIIFRLDQHFEQVLVHTGQNYDFELNKIFFSQLGIREPNFVLQSSEGSSAKTIAKCISGLDELLESESPHAVVVLGDTNSCLSVIAAKKRQIPIFHLEAGNRCFDLRVPEEVNRKIVDHASDVNIAYTEHARRNLMAEGIPADQIFVTGSPLPEVLDYYQDDIRNSDILKQLGLSKKQYFVASFHREENVDQPARLMKIIETLNVLAENYQVPIVLSTHPRTRKSLAKLKCEFNPLVQEMKPFGFFDYIRLQEDSLCVISDSGTITEEAAICGFSAITVRDAHERPEGFDNGVLIMAGLSPAEIMRAIGISREHVDTRLSRSIPAEYQNLDVSWRVVKIVQSYVEFVNRKTWRKSAL
jgi:UDP-N-acetyl-L-fucosamine synthase